MGRGTLVQLQAAKMLQTANQERLSGLALSLENGACPWVVRLEGHGTAHIHTKPRERLWITMT